MFDGQKIALALLMALVVVGAIALRHMMYPSRFSYDDISIPGLVVAFLIVFTAMATWLFYPQ